MPLPSTRLARATAPLLLLTAALALEESPAAAQVRGASAQPAHTGRSAASGATTGASAASTGATTSVGATTSPVPAPAPAPAQNGPASAGATTGATATATPSTTRGPHPFAPGEQLNYEVKFGSIKVGSGSMEVRGVVPVRGRPAYHTVFRVKGGTLFFKVNDTFESWFATDDLSSLRFHKDQNEGFKERDVRYEIFPERQTYDETTDGDPEQASVPTPLDDGSFLYFLRTVPLEVGKTYRFERYFKPERNPVTIQVLRRERIKVPAGEFDAVVVRPTIKTKGIFSEGGRAEVWLSDDDRRIVLQMKSRLSFGSLNLYLKSVRDGS